VAVLPDPGGEGGVVQPLDERGAELGPPHRVADLAAVIAAAQRGATGAAAGEGTAAAPWPSGPASSGPAPRWVWSATDEVYPPLLARLSETGGAEGTDRPARCHDVTLTERLLLGAEERYGQARSLAAAWARLQGLPVPEDTPAHAGHASPADEQDALFSVGAAGRGSGLPTGVDPLAALVAVHADQQRRLERDGPALRLLCAAESAGALAAAEMTHDGLPWRVEVHDRLLTELLGPRPPAGSGAPPRELGELALAIQRAFGNPRLNPDSPAQLLRAFSEQGVSMPSLRLHRLRELAHPAAPLVVRYRELSRIHTAHGWAWQAQWVRGGRFRPEYVVGGVVSGRWASRGGGALQIPRILRGAVVADPGWRLVVADAGQLEPRVLAAMSGDPGLARAAARGDLYAGLAAATFGGDRGRAKIALLAAMYGQTSGEAGQLVAVLRRRYPQAMELVERAARTGETGGSVRSWLGRVCPPASAEWQDHAQTEDGAGDARARGRFTRNFVVQATAAEWALALLAALRRRLAAIPSPAGRPHLVFFQHDEVVVHAPEGAVPAVLEAVAESADEARRLLFGATPVPFPLDTHAVENYADAKPTSTEAAPGEESEEVTDADGGWPTP